MSLRNWVVDGVDGMFVSWINPLTRHIDAGLVPLTIPFRAVNGLLSPLFKSEHHTMYLTVKIVSFFLGLLYRVLIPRKWHRVKYLYNLIVGILVVGTLYQSNVVYLLISVLIGYLTMRYFSRSFNRYFAFAFFHLLSFAVVTFDQMKYPNLIRYGFVTSFMHLALRTSSIAFCLHDSEVIRTNADPDERIPRRVKELALHKKPSLLQYFSYMFFHANVLNPPPIEFKHYVNSIESEAENSRPIDWSAIGKIFVGIFVYVIFIGFISRGLGWHDNMIKYEYYSTEVGLSSKFALFKMAIRHNILICAKLQFVGLFAQAICIVSGIGYSPNGKDKWENCKAVDPIQFEFSPSMRSKVTGWNVAVEKYFRYYVYFRMPFRNRMLKRFLTGMSAAFWHGSYPGFYLFYIIIIAVSQTNISLFKKLGMKNDEMEFTGPNGGKHFVTKFLVGVFNATVSRFLMSVFLLQTWNEIVLFHGVQFGWVSLYFVVVLFVVVQLMPQLRRPDDDDIVIDEKKGSSSVEDAAAVQPYVSDESSDASAESDQA